MSDDELYDKQVPYETPTPCGPEVEDVIKKANGLIAEGLNDQAVANAVVHNLVQIVGRMEARFREQALLMNSVRATATSSASQIDVLLRHTHDSE